MKRLAIITTHPIQYNAPLFKLLTQRNNITIKVFYTWGKSVLENKYDPGFKKNIEWDIPLLDGYEYTFVENVATDKGSHHFKGIDNPTIVKEIGEWNADALLVFGWSFKSHLKILRHFKSRKRILFRGDSTLLDERKNFSLKKILRSFFLKWVYSYVDFALYTGTANKLYYQKFGLADRQLKFAPHAIENARFTSVKETDLRNQLGISQTDILFLFAGKIEAKKNPSILLEAFIEINKPEIYLLVVGNGEMEKQLKQKVQSLQPALQKRIIFKDFVNQMSMPTVYKSCDVFMLTSQGPGETWGLSVNEAMACGKPVLVSDKCGCAADLVNNGVNGYIFQSGNKEDLKKKMLLITANKNKLNEMGKQSLNIINEWNFDKVATAIEEAVQGVN